MSKKTGYQKYYEENRDKILSANKKWGEKNREKRAGYTRKSKEKVQGILNARHYTKYAQFYAISIQEARKELNGYFEDKHRCNICGRTLAEIPNMGSIGRQGLHLDHVNADPTDYHFENLQLLCWKCNTCKLDFDMYDYSDPDVQQVEEAIKLITDLYFDQVTVEEKCAETHSILFDAKKHEDVV